MREVLRSYAATGRTVIVSSHLLSEIEQTCSHVVVMAKGQKIAQGTVEEIVGTGGAVLIGLADDADTARAIAVLEELPGVTAELTDEGLVADLDGTSRARALQALVEAGHRRRPVHAASPAGGRVPGAGGGDLMTRADVATEHVQPTGAVAGYRPGRTLRLSVELRRQFKRRRTIGVFALMVALPLVLIARAEPGRERQRAAEQPDQPGRRRDGERAELHPVRAVRDHRLLPGRRLRAVLRRHRGQRGPVGVAALHAGHARCRGCGCSGRSGSRRWCCRSGRSCSWSSWGWWPAGSRSASRRSRRRSG